MSWKDTVAKAYTTVPKNFREAAWKIGIGLTVVSSLLTGFAIWRVPSSIMGIPLERQSMVERLAHDEELKDQVYELMQQYFYTSRPHGLMLVAWEELDSFVGLWVRPANRFPGKAGPHSLTPDMRVLGGPFLFAECAQTESIAMPGRIMVACPIISDYDIWGYVAAIVEDTPEARTSSQRLVGFLAHRLTSLIY